MGKYFRYFVARVNNMNIVHYYRNRLIRFLRTPRQFAILIFTVVFFLLLLTEHHYGIAWDEPYNFNPACEAASWVKLVFTKPGLAFSDAGVDIYWQHINEHPSVSKWLAAASYGLFGDRLGDLFMFGSGNRIALRLGSILFFSAFIACFYGFLTHHFSWRTGWAALVSLLVMPRIFAQAHFATTDIPMMVMAWFTVYAFYKGCSSWKWSVGLGIIWGLAMATKINALFLPIPLFAWGLLYQRKQILNNLGAMVVISPIVFIASWPWLWHHTFTRLMDYFQFYTQHKFTTVFYFGKQYLLTPAPWHYPLVYVLLTIPVILLLILMAGLWTVFRKQEMEAWETPPDRSLAILMVFMAAFPIILQSLPFSPRYDGIRLFLSAFPFLAVLIGLGYMNIIQHLKRRYAFAHIPGVTLVIGFAIILPCLWQVIRTHPYELSYYNALIGGVQGAQKAGLETTYWCDSVNSDILSEINGTLPKGATVRFLSFSSEVLDWYKMHNEFRLDLKIINGRGPADYYVLQARQGFWGQYEASFYEQATPRYSIKLDNVPLAILYNNPMAPNL